VIPKWDCYLYIRRAGRRDFGRRCKQWDAMDIVGSERLEYHIRGASGRQLWWRGEVLF